jgi:4-diphosphocytidyl-2-C-methyl-D-erythritol kinase
MRSHAYAKINWDLHVLGRRADGFHELDTVMVNVSLHDILDFELADTISLQCSDPTLPTDGRNLVVRAAELLARSSGYKGGAKISLKKNIPSGGGMGGGSSDAACTLTSLNQLWGLNFTIDQLQPLAAELGSDVAFFLYGGWRRCLGRGEKVEAIGNTCSDISIDLLLLFPPWPVATPSVYKKLSYPLWDGKSKLRGLTEVGTAIESAWSSVQTNKFLELRLVNDLTAPALEVEPRLGKLQQVLEGIYPGRWLMSGSGSVHFVVLGKLDDGTRLKEKLQEEFGLGIRVHPATTFTP